MAADLEAGFAKLQGEDFEYYMQTYSIVLGRNSKKSSVDVDLAGLGGGMNISRQHARIYYDFDRKRFALQVLGKNGCHVEGVLYHPNDPPVKLDSQYLLQIGDKKFYFLLPIRSIIKLPTTPSLALPPPAPIPAPTPLPMPTIAPTPIPLPMTAPYPIPVPFPPHVPGTSRKRASSKALTTPAAASSVMLKGEDVVHQPAVKKARGHKKHEGMETTAERKPSPWLSHDSTSFMMPSSHPRQSIIFNSEPKAEARRRAETGTDALSMQVEEKEVVSAVATVLSDLCGPGEWMPMPSLHRELVEHYSGIWPPARVRKFLTADDVDGDSKGKPWAGLLALLRKYPEHFVINTRTKGRTTSEFVSLVSLLS